MRQHPQGKGLRVMDWTREETPEEKQWDADYKVECDAIAERLAGKYRKHWGRWFVQDDCLCTYVARPTIGDSPGGVNGIYDIELSRIGPNGESDGQKTYTWQRHLSQKNWMGQRGLADFTLAAKQPRGGSDT